LRAVASTTLPLHGRILAGLNEILERNNNQEGEHHRRIKIPFSVVVD
jgi:hypothetical protein